MPLVRSREQTTDSPFEARPVAVELLPSFPTAPPSAVPPAARSAGLIEDQLAAFQDEVDGLRHEVDALRRRDRSLNFYMQRLDEELRLAAKLQQDFLPKALPAVGPVRFHAARRPAGYVSGDLYDVVRLDEEHIGFDIADLARHPDSESGSLDPPRRPDRAGGGDRLRRSPFDVRSHHEGTKQGDD